MNRFSITLAAATISALALIVGSPVGAKANTYTCNDTHSDWTLATELHSDKASFWPNTANSSMREGTYIVSEGFAIVKFSDGWLRIGPTGTGDWTIGKSSGTMTCVDKAAKTPVAAPIGPMTYSYRIAGDQFIIHAKGPISDDEHVAFNAFRDTWKDARLGDVKRVILELDSPGGSVHGAMEMTEWVKRNGVETTVLNGQTCASACVLVWGAGASKWAGVEASIGVHNASTANSNTSLEAEGTLFIAKTLASEGAPPSVVSAMVTAEKTDVHWLTSSDVVAWHGVMLDKDGRTIVATASPVAQTTNRLTQADRAQGGLY